MILRSRSARTRRRRAVARRCKHSPTVAHMASVSASTSNATVKPEKEIEPILDVSVLKEQARKGLVDALNSVNGAKTLVLDPTLAGPLSLVTEVALLKVRISGACVF